MRNSLEEIKVGLKLLQLERQEDLAQYKKKFLNTTIADKKKEVTESDFPVMLKKQNIKYD